jgi:hypothetical protein
MVDEKRESMGMKVVPAKEILDKIEKGESVDYENVFVEGNIDIRLFIPQIESENNFISAPIKIVKSKLMGM